MAIDDPKAAFEQQYIRDEPASPSGLTVLAGKLAFPKAALPLEIFQKVAERLTRPSIEERLKATWDLLVLEVKHLETTKADVEDIAKAIQMALRRDFEQFDDKKRERYVKLIGNALRSETQVDNVVSFIQTVEQLNERDVTVLKVLNKIMNKEGDWKPQQNPGPVTIMKLHPSNLIQRAQELSVQIAMALGQKVETNNFTREEGYMVCTRLQGVGLAHEVQGSARELPLTNYSFRLSVYGVRLLMLLGEDVPNSEWYFRDF